MAELTVRVSGTGWFRHLVVDLDPEPRWRPRDFDIPAPGADPATGPLLPITTERWDTTARCDDPVNGRWHVKLYRCRTGQEADLLRAHLRRQADGLSAANDNQQSAPDPPWAMIPVGFAAAPGADGPRGATVPARTPVEVAAAIRAAAPEWVRAGVDAPERYVLAASPHVEAWRVEPDSAYQEPRVASLAAVTTLAAGLDRLHAAGWAHGDVKLDNIRWSSHQGMDRFVLVDADSAVPIDRMVRGLNFTAPYAYPGLLHRDLRQPVEPGLVRAHDRFGFALVVLMALAGPEWVDHMLVHPGKAAAEDVTRLLRQRWPARWAPLVDVLAEPFGAAFDGSYPIEAGGAWAAAWLARVQEVAHQPVPVPVWRQEVARRRFAERLARVRQIGHVASRRRAVEQACANAEAEAVDLAVRWAAGAAAATIAGLLAIALMIFYGVIAGG